MEKTLKEFDLPKLIKLLDFGYILSRIWEHISREILMEMMKDPRFEEYIGNAGEIEDRNDEDRSIVSDINRAIIQKCTPSDIRFLVHNKRLHNIVSDIATQIHTQSYDDIHKFRYIASTFNNPRFKENEATLFMLVKFGIYTHLKTFISDQSVSDIITTLDSPYFNQRDKRIKLIFPRINEPIYVSVYDRIFMKILCKHSRHILYSNYRGYCMILCYKYKLYDDQEEFSKYGSLNGGLMLFQRKSINALKPASFDGSASRERITLIKLIHKLLIKTFAKFTTKNMTKLILYF